MEQQQTTSASSASGSKSFTTTTPTTTTTTPGSTSPSGEPGSACFDLQSPRSFSSFVDLVIESHSPFADDSMSSFADAQELESAPVTPLAMDDSNSPSMSGGEDSQSNDYLPRDRQQRTVTYDYAFEKSMSHAEAKLFYQRHQRDSNTAGDTHTPTTAGPSASFPAVVNDAND
ncbi:AMP deaminase, partial [Ascosphaera aggregata]